jgi:hypothetical protein
VGTWRGWGKIFWLRRRRVIGRDRSEAIHESVRMDKMPKHAEGILRFRSRGA